MSQKTITTDPQIHLEANPASEWMLIGCIPPASLMECRIEAPSFVIGRRHECDLRLNSQRVSGRHAELLIVGERLVLRDLNSTNGTFLNRKRVTRPMAVSSGDHIQLADVEFRVENRIPDTAILENTLLEQKKTAPAIETLQSDWVMSQLEILIAKKAIIPHYQPIISLEDKEIVAFEALARSRLEGLKSPAKMFQTAEIVHREVDLSIICRDQAIRCAPKLDPIPPIFVNTHPHESMEDDVIPTIAAIQRERPEVPIVVEFHEKTIQSPAIMLENKAMLADIGVKVAYDDFGSGQSRLLELVQSPPDYLKFDSSLVTNLHKANPYQQRMIRMLIETAKDFGIVTIAEGIERVEEATAVEEIGFELVQGFYFGRPHPVQHYQATGKSVDKPLQS